MSSNVTSSHWSRVWRVGARGRLVALGFGAAFGLGACGGGATFRMVETPWRGDDASTARLQQGAKKLGCSASAPDSTGEIEIRCPEGAPDAERDAGSIRIGPASDGALVAMCNDGLAEGCSAVLERIWKAGG